jgi:hypothetical protein
LVAFAWVFFEGNEQVEAVIGGVGLLVIGSLVSSLSLMLIVALISAGRRRVRRGSSPPT